MPLQNILVSEAHQRMNESNDPDVALSSARWIVDTPDSSRNHRRDFAGVATGPMSLRDDDVHAVVDMPLRMRGCAGQRRDRDAGLVCLVDDVLRR